MMRRRIRWLASALFALAFAAGLLVSGPAHAAPTGPSSWNCGSNALDLEKVRVDYAPVVSSERTAQGQPISLQPLNGTWVPVIFVHGWTGRAGHPNSDGTDKTLGSFSQRVDLRTNSMSSDGTARSLVGQLQAIPGAAVFTFDYYPYSGRWVTDTHLGPALGKVVDCLAKASGQKVIIVGHSMGGLIARYAATTPDRSDIISSVITLGTPNTGSLAALLLIARVDGTATMNPGFAPQAATLRLLMAACGQVSSQDMGTVCFGLPDNVKAFDSEAGRALRTGSKELAALKSWPTSIEVTALAGEMTFVLPKPGWFTLPWETIDVPLGDTVVGSDSATAGADRKSVLSCRYQLSLARAGFEQIALKTGFIGTSSVAAQPFAAFESPCFHSTLMRSVDLAQDVEAATRPSVSRAKPPKAPQPTNPPTPNPPAASAPPAATQPAPAAPEPVAAGGPTCRAFAEMAPRTGLDSDLTAEQKEAVKAVLVRRGHDSGSMAQSVTSVRIIAYCNIYGGVSGNNQDQPIDKALDCMGIAPWCREGG